jgi:uncharacterized membrane protein
MIHQRCPHCGKDLSGGVRYCPSCGKAVDRPDASTSAAAATLPSAAKAVKHPMTRKARYFYAGLAAALSIVFITIFIDHLPGGAHPVIANQPEVAMASMFTDVRLTLQPISVQVIGGKIIFPLSVLQEKKFVQFEYATQSNSVPLLAYISPEGKLVTAIRLCEPCNSMSFRIEGTELACGTCETRWKLNNLEGLQGSCQKYPPAPIPSRLNGNFVEIDEAVVKAWKMRI